MSLIEQAHAVIDEKLPADPNIDPKFFAVKGILGAAINLVFYVGVAISLIFMIVGGIKYATSGGDVKNAGAARNTITSAAIGFVVVVGFRFIIEIIVRLLGGTMIDVLPGY